MLSPLLDLLNLDIVDITTNWLFNYSNSNIVGLFDFFINDYKIIGIITSILSLLLFLGLLANKWFKTSYIVLSFWLVHFFLFFLVFEELNTVLKEKSYEIQDYSGNINENSKDFIKITEKYKYQLHIEYRYFERIAARLRNGGVEITKDITINPQMLVFKKDSNTILKVFNYTDVRTLNEIINDFEKNAADDDFDTLEDVLKND